ESDARLLVDLNLVNQREGVFDRVFDRHHVAVGIVDGGQRRVERCGLATACRSGADQHAVRRPEKLRIARRRVVWHAELSELEQWPTLVEEPEYNFLTPNGRGRRDANVERVTLDF